MGDLTARIKAKFFRRNSLTPSATSSKNSDSRSTHKDEREASRAAQSPGGGARPRSLKTAGHDEEEGRGKAEQRTWTHDHEPNSHRQSPTAADLSSSSGGPDAARDAGGGLPGALAHGSTLMGNDLQPATFSPSSASQAAALPLPSIREHHNPSPVLPSAAQSPSSHSDVPSLVEAAAFDAETPTPTATAPVPILSLSSSSPTSDIPGEGIARKQSLLPKRQTKLIGALLDSDQTHEPGLADPGQPPPISGTMVTRKIWVKRPGASPTLVTINEDHLVDDVRDMILRKYANSLGRSFDAPDLTIRICPREQSPRQMQPDEPMGRTLDANFPGGQGVDDALLIDVPTRRTPKASPNPRFYDDRPHESGSDYFPPYPGPHAHAHHAAALPPATAIPNISHGSLHFPPAMSIVGNGQLPPLPSPGGTRRSRPKMMRMHTASPASTGTNGLVQHVPVSGPAAIGTHTYTQRPVPRSRTHSGASSDHSAHPSHPPPSAPPLPSPPAPDRSATPPPRVASPRPSTRPKKSKKNIEHPSLPPGLLNGGVPPINVLIVEDNIINLRLLEAFVKRLKVRWASAMNGREAVNKWRAGGFHLVLMDIQLPVMNGLEATREIRRIERVNNIGVFSSGAIAAPQEVKPDPDEQDRLENTEMFKSPVIIVALTASSLQSDRHEALAAGCNDFLTKPVNFVWLERKVMEWGCMQALIDFDGWRKWKDFSQKAAEEESAKKAAAAKAKEAKANKKNRLSVTPTAA